MWLLVMFDLPVTTRTHRRNYVRFLHDLVDQGFFRVQFSVYARPCATEENADSLYNRVTHALPPAGEVRILRFTDKQWARMVCFHARRRRSVEEAPEQFTFFDEETPDGMPIPGQVRTAKALEELAEERDPPGPAPGSPPCSSVHADEDEGRATTAADPPKRGKGSGEKAQATFEFFE
ncbi:MAG: CRISPR-associated endonuclease Cas2 [Fimbriimonadaceae bacterium]|nr:CRISPR-associated endonuclease Cas2 [Fimbriimonadaceae bacterium]